MEGRLGLWIKCLLGPGLLDITTQSFLSTNQPIWEGQTPPLSPAYASSHFLWSDSTSDKPCKSWQIKIGVWWSDIPTSPHGPVRNMASGGLVWEGKGQLPPSRRETSHAVQQRLLVMAPCITHSVAPVKLHTTPGCSLCWNVLAGWQLAWHSAAFRLPAQYWGDQKMILEEADEFSGFMILLRRRKWCAFG